MNATKSKLAVTKPLIPESIAKRIPSLELPDIGDDPKVYVILFGHDISWTWYVMWYDPEYRVCWGFVDGEFPEFGDFDLNELESLPPFMGILPQIERDKYTTLPVRLSTLVPRMSPDAQQFFASMAARIAADKKGDRKPAKKRPAKRRS